MKPFILLLLVLSAGISHLFAQTLRVMSYNIHVGQDAAQKHQLGNMARFIKSSKADIVGIQEVDSVCNRSGKIDQMKYLAEQTGMYYAYARHFAFDGGSYGIGILSKTPLSNVRDHRIILTSSGTTDAPTRAFLTANVFSGKKQILFGTVHMDYRDSKSRLVQAEELVKLLKGEEMPVILTGDLNAEPGTREIVKLESVLTDTGNDTDLSFPSVAPVKKIDYIMVSKSHLGRVRKSEVPQVHFSDHLPVISTLQFKRKLK